MKYVLSTVGWLGILFSGFGAYLKIFESDEVVALYAGGSRNLDINITIAAFCLIFWGLAAILDRLDKS